ncbi:MAG: uracil-DNA glycosylase [Nitrospirota bacterium]
MPFISRKIEIFLSLLKQSVLLDNVFNPWLDIDAENDMTSEAPEIRTVHLKHYINSRKQRARYLLIGEAIGFQGGHFSGIAMTSERILLGYKKKEGIYPEYVLPDIVPRRTSKPQIMPKGFSEPTATIVWGALLNYGLKPDEFVLWNVFPWHPFDPERGMLSNRRPASRELAYGFPVLKKFINLFSGVKIIALGKIASETFASLNIKSFAVRHPANAGAKDFREAIKDIL